ncbi:HEAT repeat domain-containing protein [Polyangium sp. y55x31]|uniref:HEAT repeat domain-containing protein n=1 Tax=Polyangium sp. y55x31 TaxID=3042688 RepID=UPI00248236DE|nr:HEAT repeat domain-containing protein [Polyangium sp. y55x31]MDI1483998.1 HEAT repeat domain-containing protein [Polyangium sp. y55x31]
MRRSFALFASLTFAALSLAPVVASAQGIAVGVGRRAVDEDEYGEVSVPPRGTLRGSFGVPVAERLLVSGSVEERLRGVRRLGAIGTPEAIDALTNAFEQSSILTRDGRTRLEGVRILAAHADREAVRPLLMRELSEGGPEARAASHGGLARGAAALALARSRDKKALSALVGAVMQGGPGGEAASAALVVYPPASIAPLLEGRRRIEPALAALLGDLGDVRAIPRLRQALEDTDPTYRAAAALALARLGDTSAQAAARTWVKNDDVKQKRAGAEVLARLGADGAAEAIAALLAAGPTRLDGVRLALTAPSPALVKPLVAALEALDGDDREQAIAAIGRAGGPEAATALLAQLGKPEHATAAAFALARMPGKDARASLERALGSTSAKKGAPRRLITRAALVRALVLGDEPSGLGEALDAMANEKDPADRAVSVFGRVATGRTSVRAALDAACPEKRPCDVAIVAAVARASLSRAAIGKNDAPAELARVLGAKAAGRGFGAQGAEGDPKPQASKGDAPSAIEVAAGVALLADPSGAGLPTALLARWAEGESPLAPLAARALPSRDDEAIRSRIKRLLAGTDPVIRAHTALGLALDPEPDATSLLANAYRFEDDPTVRRAVVRALSARREPLRVVTLELARDLDPDDQVRALARAALSGRTLLPTLTVPRGPVAWISLVANAPSALASIQGRAARLVRSDGVAVPIVADPDGVVLVPGLPDGPAALTLAPEAIPGDAGSP